MWLAAAQERVTPEEVLALAERTEVDVEGGLSPRPLMSVPHPLSGESCCYYHGAVLQAVSCEERTLGPAFLMS